MKWINNNDSSYTPGAGPSHLKDKHADSMPAAAEKDISHRESAVMIAEDAVLSREKSVAAREDATHLRERHTMERASGISDDHRNILQLANERLVIAMLEAHQLTEKVKIASDHIAHLAYHDVLTGLPNRMLLLDRLNQAIELVSRQGSQLAVMFMDLDQFKHVNDSLGHAVGDQLLRSVAQRLMDCVRHSDTISRQGGDEFVLLMPIINHPEDAELFAQKMLAALTAPHHIEGHDLHISTSIGISIYPSDGQDAETLIKNADAAMYHAKGNGRNDYKFFEQNINDRAVLRQSTEAYLRRALEQQEFVLHYQPKINLHNGAIVGAEALIRWRHPERGLLLPAEFVPVAEDCGLIQSIDRWVLREACLQARTWQQAGMPPIIMSVNTSANEFAAKDILENIRATLSDTGLEPRYLQLELTESVLMRDVKSASAVLHALADMGVKLAVDDFGTGYSSLSYLRQFPIDTLKIDKTFVSRMTSNSDDAIIVSTVISMGNSLKKLIIAEGVETPEQYAYLRDQHCDEGQGYYFFHPLESVAFATTLASGVPPNFVL